MAQPDDLTRSRIAELLADRPLRFEEVTGGYTPAARWRVHCASGEIVFVKMGTTDHTSHALRAERDVYESLEGDFMPRFGGFDEDAEAPLLAIEDLGDARWPPPWDDELVASVRRTLDRLHRAHAPASLRPFDEVHRKSAAVGWRSLIDDPTPFLKLGLCSARWLDRALPRLVEESESAATRGDSPVHFDVRSDNLCATSRGVVLVDWNLTCLGSADLDTGFWLPSLELEGGPSPESVLPDSPPVAAWVSGFFAARAGGEPIRDAPRVRWIQRKQLELALPWAVRALALPPLDRQP